MTHPWLDRPAPRKAAAAPVAVPFPDFTGQIGMRELAAARKLLQSGLDLPRAVMLRIVDRAVELVVCESFQHDDSCTWWLGASCDCPHGRPPPW